MMKTQRHHKVPRSRGGSDDDWNLVDESEYDHAYSHALDFVLFDIAPWMDNRMKGYSMLPESLKDAVRLEQSVRATKRNREWVENGTHPMQKEENKSAAADRAKVWVEQMVKEGTHPSLKEGASERLTAQNLERVKNGTHNLLGEEAGKRASDLQLKRVQEGVHQWTTEEHSTRVSERFAGAKHWVNEKGERKFQKNKPEGEWQNGRKWRTAE